MARNLIESNACELAVICDQGEANLARARQRHPGVATCTDCATLFADPSIDAIVVAAPVVNHHSLGKAALEAGKHVLIEKPLTATAAEAEDLIAVAERQGRVLMVGHTFEYSPPVVKVKEIIDSGELGDVYFMMSSRVNLGILRPDVSVIWDLAPHDFSILFAWLGEEPSAVAAFGRGCIDPSKPDVAFVNLRFPSGVVAEVQLSWLSPVKLRRTVVVGSKKMLLYEDTEPVESIKVFDHRVEFDTPESFGQFQLSYRTGDIVSPRVDSYEPLMAEVRHFLECVSTGALPRTDGASGLRVVRALEAAEASITSGGGFVEVRA